jgi:hypothetical protein
MPFRISLPSLPESCHCLFKFIIYLFIDILHQWRLAMLSCEKKKNSGLDMPRVAVAFKSSTLPSEFI